MSHQSFAAIWIQLEARTDIDNILRELIGQNSLESSVLVNSDELSNSSLRLIVFIKVIFDLQRTYSQCATPSSESSHLLQPRQLLLAIIYLLRIKSKVFRCSEDTSTQYATQRSFLAQALVSGLRALWLRKCSFPEDDIVQLRDTFDEAWKGDELNYLDRFLIRILRRMILEGLPNPRSELSRPACGRVQLRNYSTGLYPLESRPDELLIPVRAAASYIDINSPAGFRDYWTLFDIAWTTEAALIQLCVNSSNPRDSAKSAPPTQDDIRQLHITRRKVLGAIFGSPTMEAVAKDSIAAILLTPCRGEICNCLEGLSAQQDHPDTTSANSRSLDGYKPAKPNIGMSQFLDESLPFLAISLESRKEELRDCNGEMRDLSDSLDDYMDAWYSEMSSISLANSDSRHNRRTAYIIPCPNLHPIPYDILKGLIEHSDLKFGLEDLENNSPLFNVDISCSQCKDLYPVEWARQIEPLRCLSAVLEEKLHRKPSTRSEWYQEVTYGGHLQGDSSGNSSSCTGSNSTSLSEKKSPRQGRLKDFFDESPKKQSKHLRTPPSYSFSADGQSLLLWIRYGAHVVFYDISSEEVEKFPANDVSFAAAGAKFYAVISNNANDRNLHVHQRSDGKPVIRQRIDAPVLCIALSRNDKFIALGFASEVWIYEIEDKRIHRHTLPPMTDSRPDSQRVCFSADCEKVIVATRNLVGNVYTYVSECTRRTTDLHLPLVKIPTGHGTDFGLSSVLYDNNSGYVCITAFTRKTPPALLSLQSRTPQLLDAGYHAHLGTQIQCAAHSPSGLKFTFVNDKNEIFSAQRHSDANWHVEKMASPRPARKPIVMREDMMAISMPKEDIIHLFWIKGEEWVLMTI